MSVASSHDLLVERPNETALEDVACNLCGARNTRVLYPSTLGDELTHPKASHFRCTSSTYGLHPTIVRCQNCGLVYANPRLAAHTVEENYSAVDDPLYIEEREGRVLTFRRNLQPFEKLIQAPRPWRLLDVGSHIGVLLQVAQERGFEAVGVEPSAWAAARAREAGLTVVNSTLAKADLAPNSFDAVTMWDVIEHLTDPAGDLRHVHRVLKPGGIVAIHTIDIDSTLSKIMGPRWPWLMEMHLYYFSPRTLHRMLEQTGFKVEQVTVQGRYLRLAYLITRIKPYSRTLARVFSFLAKRLHLEATAIPINFGDLFTIFARKV